jgi:hypothetical protein
LHLRYQENEVIGYTSALVSVIYGVLAGFATLYLINNNNSANDAVQREASSVANIYRDSRGLDDPLKSILQTGLKAYLTQVINVEWPQMSTGKTVSNQGEVQLQNVFDPLNHASTRTPTQSLLIADMLRLSSTLNDARQQRIQLSYASLSSEVWVVIFVGTILTLCISYLFGVDFRLHIFITMAAALMTSSIMFLLISLDKPFQGDGIVGPDMLIAISKSLNTP